MGHSHGIKWSERDIGEEIKAVMKIAKIDTFPTHSLMNEITGSAALSCAVSKNGGTTYWAQKLNVEIKPCESKMGYEFECKCMDFLESEFGYDCELTKARYPYDVIANRNIKIDVKSSHLYNCKSGSFYTFNLEKKNPTCDIFVCYCIDNEGLIRTYVIPSCVLSGITQLSIGSISSKYDKYKDNWQLVHKYDEFYKRMIS